MNHEILNAALDSIDATLIEEYTAEQDRLKKRGRITKAVRALGSAAACFAVLFAVMIIARLDLSGDATQQPPKDHDKLPPNAGEITTTPIDGAAPPTDSGARITLTFGGKTYTAFLYPDNSPAAAVSEENLGEPLGKATVLGLSEATECEIYSVIDRDDALAVKLPSGEYALALIPSLETIN